MSKIESQFLKVGYMDELAEMKSSVHSISPLAKLISTLVFIVSVVSFDRYTVSALLPFFIFPVVMITAGGLPAGYLLKNVLIVSPFALMVGVFNPFIDTDTMISLFGIDISGGWISFASIMLRFTLTVLSALILLSLTGFYAVCASLERLKVPGPFVVQLMFLYRYIFVLLDEGVRMSTARTLRSFGRGSGIKVYSSMLGHLLLRSMDRAQRIHLAMFSRGFDGSIRTMKKISFTANDALFTFSWSVLFIFFRKYDTPQILGDMIMRMFL